MIKLSLFAKDLGELHGRVVVATATCCAQQIIKQQQQGQSGNNNNNNNSHQEQLIEGSAVYQLNMLAGKSRSGEDGMEFFFFRGKCGLVTSCKCVRERICVWVCACLSGYVCVRALND